VTIPQIETTKPSRVVVTIPQIGTTKPSRELRNDSTRKNDKPSLGTVTVSQEGTTKRSLAFLPIPRRYTKNDLFSVSVPSSS
jgi:hypothetical protein